MPASASPPVPRPPFRRILIANRGEIAVRIIGTAREMGIETVAVFSDADRTALHVRRADRAVRIGAASPAESYLRIDALLDAARRSECDAVHPGYGFLAENAEFAAACASAGLVFIGPSPAAIDLLGDKIAARRAAADARVPQVPGLMHEVGSADELRQEARKIGLPVMLKAAAGGGGKGIRVVERAEDLPQAMRLAAAEAQAAFGDGRIYLEKFLPAPRHVEIQIMADRHGNVVHYGERECSVQRRHQKLIEESPSAALSDAVRAEMGDAACRLARSVGYLGAGTVEFLFSGGAFYFLEMNTRLQVEHAVTEMRFGVDLVREQIRVAAGERAAAVPAPAGHAIEIRVNAEDPETFFPALGVISRFSLPGGPGVRVDAALYPGLEVTPHYDSMLAKLIVHAGSREHAIARAVRALEELRIVGVATSLPVALRVFADPDFRRGEYDTGILGRIDKAAPPARRETAALAAALSRFARTERTDAGAAPSGGGALPWKLLGRLDQLGGRPR